MLSLIFLTYGIHVTSVGESPRKKMYIRKLQKR